MSHNLFTTTVLTIGLIGLWVIACIVFNIIWTQIDEASKNKFIRLTLKGVLILASYQIIMSKYIALN